jgi:hypothetical protein
MNTDTHESEGLPLALRFRNLLTLNTEQLATEEWDGNPLHALRDTLLAFNGSFVVNRQNGGEEDRLSAVLRFSDLSALYVHTFDREMGPDTYQAGLFVHSIDREDVLPCIAEGMQLVEGDLRAGFHRLTDVGAEAGVGLMADYLLAYCEDRFGSLMPEDLDPEDVHIIDPKGTLGDLK